MYIRCLAPDFAQSRPVMKTKTIGYILGIIYAVAGISYACTKYVYTREMPQVPSIQDGRTLMIDGFYGKLIYVNEREYYLLRAMEYACWVSGGVFLIYAIKYGRTIR